MGPGRGTTRGLTVATAMALVLTGCGGSGSDNGPPSEPPPVPPRVATVVPDGPAIRPSGGESYVNPGGVVEHRGRWWALANSFSSYPGESRTDLLVSEDLASWQLARPRVITEQDVASQSTFFPMTLLPDDDGGWVAYAHDYVGLDREGSIHRLTAPRLEGPWTVDPEPVLGPGAAGGWSSGRLAEPEVVRTEDGGWVMWFTGIGPDGAAIGHATSEDGVSWTADDAPVLSGTQGWTGGEVDGPQVVATDEGYLMVYASAPRGRFDVGIAFSEDGVEWEPWTGNPVLDHDDFPETAGLFQAALVRDGDRVVLLQESGPGSSFTVVHAVTIDGTTAQDTELPVIEADAEVGADAVLVDVQASGFDLALDPSEDPAALHPHVYVDIPPPPPGATVPDGAPGIVHGTSNRLEVEELPPGPHDLWVVLSDGREQVVAVPGSVRVRVTVP